MGLLSSCGTGRVSDPTPPPATVSVSAPGTRVTTGGNTLQFTPNVQNASNPAVQWEVATIPGGNSTVGTVSTSGLYTSPPNVPSGGMVEVRAVLVADQTKFGAADITVIGPPLSASGVFSWRNDAMISGVNTQEAALTPATVSGGGFGKLFACPVDGFVYAQPLYVANLPVPAMGTHNVVFVATEHDSVYAFDADANPCQTLWQTSFLSAAAGVTTVPSCPFAGQVPAACLLNGDENDVGSDDIEPEIGITGTPVIDPVTRTLYVVAATKEPPPSTPAYFSRLHALDLASGAEKFGGPIAIQGAVSGTGDGSFGGKIAFVPLIENQRCALQFDASGYVYIAFASHGDQGAYHGWMFAYSTSTLGPNSVPVVFNVTPSGSAGGIWEGGAPPSVDANGSIYIASGNGTFDGISGWGDTLLKLSPASAGLAVLDSITPFDQGSLNSFDLDFGSGGVLLLPDSAGTALHRHLAIAVGEEGKLYLVDRDSLGGYTPPPGPDKVVNTLGLPSGIFSTPAYWQGSIYVADRGGALQAYSLATLANGAAPAPTSNSSEIFGYPGVTPAISANGSSNGIVWVQDVSGYQANNGIGQAAVLHAYDATNLANELYNSTQRNTDIAGNAVKFTVPTVINGKVYVGTQTELSVYGLMAH